MSKPCTALLLDIRNFTPNLKACSEPESEPEVKKLFLKYISKAFYECFKIINRVAKHKGKKVYVNSTGDGFVAVFFSDRHYIEAFLSGLLIHNSMRNIFNNDNTELKEIRKRFKGKKPEVLDFGIGIDSGTADKIRFVEKHYAHLSGFGWSFIGDVINSAARVESSTKDMDSSRMIVTQNTNQFLCTNLCVDKNGKAVDYNSLIKESKPSSHLRYKYQNQMNIYNYILCIQFTHNRKMKGIETPVALYRISESLAKPERTEFISLVEKLESILKKERYEKYSIEDYVEDAV
ncbi:MAG TPA: hypothetical protein PKH33_10265 [bacterium]|nr:hypothetical protein [bacterium]